MPVSCSAVNCKNRWTKDNDRSFFKFPLSNRDLTKRWVLAMRRDQWAPTRNSSLCSDHFLERNFRYNNGRRSLQPNVVPTLFVFQERSREPAAKRPRLRDYRKTAKDKRADEDGGCSDSVSSQLPLPPRGQPARPPSPPPETDAHVESAGTRRQLSLQQLALGLKERLCETANVITEHCYEGMLRQLSLHRAGISKITEYPERVVQFATSVLFHSAKAYNYLRRSLRLPEPAAIRLWAEVEGGRAGFTAASFDYVRRRVAAGSVLGCLSLCTVPLRRQLEWDVDRMVGHHDLAGAPLDHESCPLAGEALVFALTSVELGWRLPLGYCLVAGVDVDTRINLIHQYVRKLHETGVTVVAVTLDGAVAASTVERLGVDISNSNTMCWFPHPSVASTRVHCLVEPQLLIESARARLEQVGTFVDRSVADEELVEWKHLAELLSNPDQRWSIADESTAFRLASFPDRSATVRFVSRLADMRRLLDSCHPLASGQDRPITALDMTSTMDRVHRGYSYLRLLKLQDGPSVLHSHCRHFAFGLSLNLLSVQSIAEEYVWADDATMPALLTRRLGHGLLRNLLLFLRQRCDASALTAAQFRSVYVEFVNRCLLDSFRTLRHDASANRHSPPKRGVKYGSLTAHCPDVRRHMASLVLRSCHRQIDCEECRSCLYRNGCSSTPSDEVVRLCAVAETVFRWCGGRSTQALTCATARAFISTTRRAPFEDQPHLWLATEPGEESHHSHLVRLISSHYFTLRRSRLPSIDARM